MANILATVNGLLCSIVIFCVLQSMASSSLLPLIRDKKSCPLITLNSPEITCTLESVHDLPSGDVSCPKEDTALVVKGDYGEAHIKCSARFEIQFNFEGIKPTAAIHVDYLNANTNGALKSYNIHVRISSISTVWRDALRRNPEIGALPNAFNYSRTGNYMFRGRKIQHRSMKHDFYIFFEEPGAKAEFIRSEQMGVSFDESNVFAYVPCLPTHHSASVQLKPANTLRPSKISSLRTSHRPQDTSYTCTLTYGQQTDVLIFDVNQNQAPKDIGPIDKTMLEFVSGKASEDYNDDAMAICKNILGSQQPMSLAIQYFSTKYDYESLYKFVLPKYRNRSHLVITKVANSSAALSIVSSNLTRGRTGVISCGNDEYLDVKGFSVDFKGQAHVFNYQGVDITLQHFKREILGDPGRILRISSSEYNENTTTIFAGDDVSLACHFDSFYLCSPRIWVLVYLNGTSSVLGEEHVTESNGVSVATVRLHLELTQVSCSSAICTSAKDIVSISKAVTVQPRPTTPSPSTVPSSTVSSLAVTTLTMLRTTTDARPTGSANRTSGVNSTVQEESIESSGVNEAAAAFVAVPILLAVVGLAVYFYVRRKATLALHE